MKKIILLSLIFGLFGCQKTENKTKEIVLNSLKDPSSAQFQNVKGYCGEVNAKNSYGGYIGFRRFYISNEMPIFYDEDSDDPQSFARGWIAHCESNSKLDNTKKDACVSYSNFAAAVVKSKLAGVPVGTSKNTIDANTEEDRKIYFKTIDEGYKSNNSDAFALQVLDGCLKGEIKTPS
ncbi:hypothetical protein [Acinetobacter sp. Leaf130]|uniref:hypothetical protein n=1 Tax=Acinetobacter sp. Leaf130 TaxID=1736269 RepID=UPI0006F24F69|nr:hypothetical protein [Acinetobacter sp. Leaf130]KQQ77226.1 hypothetical protein ASF86_06890 [Acinetobacter sp. Leaf130]